MNIITDANIFFATVVKSGITRKLWFSPYLDLYAPDFILQEISKYNAYMIEKFQGNEENYRGLQRLLLNRINFISESELEPFLEGAAVFTGDEKDLFYIACALYIGCGIWSNDKHFKKQKRIQIKTTEELAKEVGLL